MSKASDELRKVAHEAPDGWDAMTLIMLADRIDAEMVELPRDRDWVPIHVGDTVYLKDGRKYHVSRVNIARDHTSIDVNPCGTGRLFFSIEPTRFTHTAPDSWERIANELVEWCNSVDVDGDACGKPRDLSDRIRKLAAKEDEQCH